MINKNKIPVLHSVQENYIDVLDVLSAPSEPALESTRCPTCKLGITQTPPLLTRLDGPMAGEFYLEILSHHAE